MKNWKIFILCLVLVFVASACSANTGSKSQFPSKSIEVVAAGSPGGGLDLFSRAIEQAMTEAKLNDQSMVIKNMGGGGGNEAKAYINKQKGEPHFLYAESNRIYVNQIVGTTTLGIEAVTPIARLITEYLVWAVKADSPYQSAQDILEKLKADPKSIDFGVGTIPSDDQMNILRPAMEYGINPKDIRIVAFKSGGDLMAQLLGGHISVISTGASEAMEQVKAGKVRILAISSQNPLDGEFKDIPTWKANGVDVDIMHWRGLFAPPDLKPEVIEYWDDKLGELVKTDAWKNMLEKYGWYDAYADSATFAKDLEEEAEITGNLLKDLGLAK